MEYISTYKYKFIIQVVQPINLYCELFYLSDGGGDSGYTTVEPCKLS